MKDRNQTKLRLTKELDEARRKLLFAEKQLRDVCRLPSEDPFPILQISRTGHLIYANGPAQTIVEDWGVQIGEQVPKDWKDHISQALESGATNRNIEILHNGRTFSFTLVPEIEMERVDAFGLDVTESKQALVNLQRLAEYDQLTGLPNRRLFSRLLDEKLAKANQQGHACALLYVDINNFKQINDTFGQKIGDRLLKKESERWSSNVRHVETVARVGADEFGVILRNVENEKDAVAAVRKILDKHKAPVRLSDRKVSILDTVGLACFPDHAQTAANLLAKAETAMRRARVERRPLQVFDAQMAAKSADQEQLAHDLNGALSRREFVIHYQPIMETQTSRIVAVEALLRWQHPSRGLLAPDQFLDVVVNTGQIVPVGAWVLSEGCEQLRAWRAGGHTVERMAVSINLSVRQLDSSDIVDMVSEALGRARLDPHQLELEITETTLMLANDKIRDTLREFKEMGIKLTIDDFGIGYSSLAYLKEFPLDILKVDRSFTRTLPGDKDNLAIVAMIISLAHQLDLSVVAEGVETQKQLRALRDLNCDAVQGFFFSKPVPAEDFSRLLDQEHPFDQAA